MKRVINGVMLFGSVLATSCAHGPDKGSLEYIDKQVYQCRTLCANAEVNIAQIEGLSCVCSKPTATSPAPVIYNPMFHGSNSSNSVPFPTAMSPPPSVIREIEKPIIVNGGGQIAPISLSPADNATKIEDATGRVIYSQPKQ